MPAPVLILATQNQKKKRELVELIEDAFEGAWTVKTLDELGLGDLDIVEDAETFDGNARIKVDAIASALEQRTGDSPADEGRWAAILADDSGLCVDALDGAPGVRSARFAQDHDAGAGDDDNNALLVRRLTSVPEADRGAAYVCFIAVRLASGAVFTTNGEVRGRIALEPKGHEGFGYDPYFVPVEAVGESSSGVRERHMAELSPAEKHAISHRGRATRAALTKLVSTLGG